MSQKGLMSRKFIGIGAADEEIWSGDRVEWLEDVSHDNIFSYCSATVIKLDDGSVYFKDVIHHRPDGLDIEFDMDKKLSEDVLAEELIQYCSLL